MDYFKIQPKYYLLCEQPTVRVEPMVPSSRECTSTHCLLFSWHRRLLQLFQRAITSRIPLFRNRWILPSICTLNVWRRTVDICHEKLHPEKIYSNVLSFNHSFRNLHHHTGEGSTGGRWAPKTTRGLSILSGTKGTSKSRMIHENGSHKTDSTGDGETPPTWPSRPR